MVSSVWSFLFVSCVYKGPLTGHRLSSRGSPRVELLEHPNVIETLEDQHRLAGPLLVHSGLTYPLTWARAPRIFTLDGTGTTLTCLSGSPRAELKSFWYCNVPVSRVCPGSPGVFLPVGILIPFLVSDSPPSVCARRRAKKAQAVSSQLRSYHNAFLGAPQNSRRHGHRCA